MQHTASVELISGLLQVPFTTVVFFSLKSLEITLHVFKLIQKTVLIYSTPEALLTSCGLACEIKTSWSHKGVSDSHRSITTSILPTTHALSSVQPSSDGPAQGTHAAP